MLELPVFLYTLDIWFGEEPAQIGYHMGLAVL